MKNLLEALARFESKAKTLTDMGLEQDAIDTLKKPDKQVATFKGRPVNAHGRAMHTLSGLGYTDDEIQKLRGSK